MANTKTTSQRKEARAADVLELATVKVQALQVRDDFSPMILFWAYQRDFWVETFPDFYSLIWKDVCVFLENWGGFYYCTTVLPLD